MMTRRDLLIRSAALSSGLVTVGASMPDLWRLSAMAAEPRTDSSILVVVELGGGNDGLNTVIPHADDNYHKSRPRLRIGREKVLKLDDHVGLHPALHELHEVWKSSQLAVVQGVGYPNPNRSHTRSMEIWQTGEVGPAPPVGWLGRTADANPSVRLCHVAAQDLPLALRGQRATPDQLSSLVDYRLAPTAMLAAIPAVAETGDSLLSQVQRQFVAARELAARLAAKVPITAAAMESGETLEGRLETIRRLIEADLPARVYYTAQDGFDTHINQRFTHQQLLAGLSQAVTGFLKKLKESRLDERVVVLIFTEFGRRLKENAAEGTDHGTVAPVLIAGKPVKGGLFGRPADLADLDPEGDPRFTTDFREVYATLLRRWLAVDPEPIIGRREGALAFIE